MLRSVEEYHLRRICSACSFICSQIVECHDTWLIRVLEKHGTCDVSITSDCSLDLPAENLSSYSSMESDQDTHKLLLDTND